jgi:DNA-binding IclR family transcriptional regulator
MFSSPEPAMTKIEVLDLFASLGELSASEISERLEVPLEASCMMLLRLTRQKLLARERVDGVFIYRRTPKGEARLAYLARATR